MFRGHGQRSSCNITTGQDQKRHKKAEAARFSFLPEREITTLEKKRSRRTTLNMPIKERVATTTAVLARQLVLLAVQSFRAKRASIRIKEIQSSQMN